tara:strand:+ start:1792 stop:2247 length:456 start_codon:yes stop_codon:yes gene_type:complete
MKKCKKCNQLLNLEEFARHKECKDGYGNTCKKCKLILQRKKRKVNNNSYTKKYEKTKNGFLVRLYNNMKNRINGTHNKSHLYANKELIDKKTFYEWSLNNNKFHNLFEVWKDSEYKRVLTPSVDRIDSEFGYKLDNMRWVTFSENCKNVKR